MACDGVICASPGVAHHQSWCQICDSLTGPACWTRAHFDHPLKHSAVSLIASSATSVVAAAVELVDDEAVVADGVVGSFEECCCRHFPCYCSFDAMIIETKICRG